MHPAPKLCLPSLILAMALAACNADPDKTGDGFAPPAIVGPGAADIIGDDVDVRGRISFGGEVFGDFIADDQLEGWFFTARAGAIITIDNSNQGTRRWLDSTLFLYGPKDETGFYGTQPLAFDDDGGWGFHARIGEFVVPRDGEYLIVIGTYLNSDRGNYRLTLSCYSGSCIIPCDEACPSDDPCSGSTCSAGDGCIDAAVDPSCNSEKAFAVSASELLTAEGLESDRFSVHLTAEPDEHVTLRVASSDNDEVAVYPQRLLFCAAGHEETDNGCTPLEEGVSRATPHWQRVIFVTVVGMNDQQDDGDADYTVTFEVESLDEDYANATPAAIEGINLDGDLLPDYSVLDGLVDEALLEALSPLVADHQAYGYLGQNSARTLMFSAIDLHDSLVESLYTGETTMLPSDSRQAYQQGFNTEHTWPQGQFDRLEPMKSDLHHVFPTDIRSNSSRSSYDYGMTCDPDAAGSVLGPECERGGRTVYQVRPERRGDVARAHFYMVARYRSTVVEGSPFDDNSDGSDGCISAYEEAVLRAWHLEDPVDDLERERNNRIEGYQWNRNPFVDRPDLVDRISDF